VTPRIPIVMSDMPPGVRESRFQVMASTLIHGDRDAVLADAFMTVEQANALADWIAAKRKNLTTVYITHGHGDHGWRGPICRCQHTSTAIDKATGRRMDSASPELGRSAANRDRRRHFAGTLKVSSAGRKGRPSHRGRRSPPGPGAGFVSCSHSA